MMRAAVVSIALAAIYGANLRAAVAPAEDAPGRAAFSVSSDLVLVPVAVVDSRGANIEGLAKENFTVLDDRRPQPIAAFYSEDAPCSVGVVLDASGSVKSVLDWEKKAARAFLEASNPEDEVFVAAVSSAPSVLAPLSVDPRSAEEQALAVRADGWTALYDTVHMAAERLKDARRGCRALLAISDGMDNHSRLTKSAMMRDLVERDIQIYTIAMEGVASGVKAVQRAESQRGLALMSDLAAKTGGLGVTARDSQDPAAAARRVAAVLRNRYVIGYRVPDGDSPDKWHAISIKVDRSRVSVYARAGYRQR